MIDHEEEIAAELLLCEGDFPSNYTHMAHPNDYLLSEEPIKAEFISHRNGHHNRLLFRISWKLSEGNYLPMTFVCDTGAPMHFYFSGRAMKAIESRIKTDELGVYFV